MSPREIRTGQLSPSWGGREARGEAVRAGLCHRDVENASVLSTYQMTMVIYTISP